MKKKCVPMLKTASLLMALMLLAVPVSAENPDSAQSPEKTPTADVLSAETEAAPVPGYVYISSPTGSGWLPLPAEGDLVFPLRQILPDGRQTENVLHLTPEGVCMESATCDNHDCIGQGTVTLQNRQDRILSNMIICLPNQVTVQLFSPEEFMSLAGAPLP